MGTSDGELRSVVGRTVGLEVGEIRVGENFGADQPGADALPHLDADRREPFRWQRHFGQRLRFGLIVVDRPLAGVALNRLEVARLGLATSCHLVAPRAEPDFSISRV